MLSQMKSVSFDTAVRSCPSEQYESSFITTSRAASSSEIALVMLGATPKYLSHSKDTWTNRLRSAKALLEMPSLSVLLFVMICCPGIVDQNVDAPLRR